MRIEILLFLNIILTIICPFIKKKIETPLETELRIIAVDLINNIISMTNKTELEKKYLLNGECLKQLSSSLMTGNITTIINNSGHSLMRLGNQKKCESKSLFTYHLFIFTFNLTKKNLFLNGDLNYFLGIKKKRLGLCLFNKCDNLVSFILKQKNKDLYDYLKKNYGIFSIKEVKTDKKYKLTLSFLFSCFIIFPVFFIRVFVQCFSFFFFNEENFDTYEEDRKKILEINYPLNSKEKDNSKESIKKSDKIKSKFSTKTLFNYYTKKEKTSNDIILMEQFLNDDFSNNSKTNKISLNYILNNTFMNKIYNYLFEHVSHKNIFQLKNKVHLNESKIEMLSGLRTIILILITSNKIVKVFYEYPSSPLGNLDFYDSFNFIIIKFSTYAESCWVFLDGFIYCYKFMFWIKKNNQKINCYYSFLFLIKVTFPKIFVFFLINFCVFRNLKDISQFFGAPALFENFYQMKGKSKLVKNPLYFLIPFYVPYFMKFNFCFNSNIIIINEFYCLFFLIFFIYFLYKIRNPVFDYIILFFFSLNIILSFLNYSNIEFKKYTLEYILGENLILKNPHMSINIFFYGAFIGLLYFYYIDSLSNISNFQQNKHYYPFIFIFKLLSILKNDKQIERYFLSSLSFIILFVFASFYSVGKKIYLRERVYIFDFKLFWKIIYIYEKYIFVIFFGIMTFMLISSYDKFWVKIFLRGQVFISISRFSYSFFLTEEIIAYLFFTLFDMSTFDWNYQNIFYITCVLTLLNFCISEILTIFFEIPIRIFIINFFQTNFNYENENLPGKKSENEKKFFN